MNMEKRMERRQILTRRLYIKILLSILLIFVISWDAHMFLNANGKPMLLDIDNIGGALSFQYQVTGQKLTYLDLINIDRRDNYSEIGLNFNTRGSIYHPNLLYFNINFNIIGFKQKSDDFLFSDSTINNSVKNSYNIKINFLKQKKINFQFFTIKYYSSSQRRIEERNFTNSTETGISVYSNTKILPLDLMLSRITNKYETFSFVKRDEDIKNIKLRVNLLPLNKVKSLFKFTNKNYSDSVFNLDYTSTIMNINLFLPYGSGRKSQLSFIGGYNKMGGDYDTEKLRFNFVNIHYLKPNLAIRTNIDADFNKYSGRSNNGKSVESLFEYKLFDSLISRLGGSLESIDSENQSYNIFSIKGLIDYSKKIKNGLIYLHYEKQFRNGEYMSKSLIADRSDIYKFSSSDFIFLTLTGISTESIRITDPDLSVLYINGIDYSLEIVDNQVLLSRIPGGSIKPESNIRVSFQYLSFPDFTLKNNPHQFYLNFDFLKHFSVFYKNILSNHEIISEFTVSPFSDIKINSIGVKVNSNIITGEYTIEKNENSSGVYNSKNYRLSFNVKPLKVIRLGLNFTGNRIDFQTSERFNDFSSIMVDLSVNPSSKLNINAFYRKLNYLNQTNSWFRESLVFKFQWNLRKIIVDMFYENVLHKAGNSDRNNDHFVFRIRRLF